MTTASELTVQVYGELRLEQGATDRVRAMLGQRGAARAVLDGAVHRCRRGAWAVWIPGPGLKFLNSVDGQLACRHPNAPRREEILGPAPSLPARGRYSVQDWRAAFRTPVARRAAENAVATARLHRAGLGPRLLGLCVARKLIDGDRRDGGFAAGIVVEDARGLPAKAPAHAADMERAGVGPDRIRSAIRQQVNGYIVDLNSVAGVMPLGAEDEVAAIEAQILAAAGVAGGDASGAAAQAI